MSVLVKVIGSVAAVLDELIFPRGCAGCGLPDAVLCPVCEGSMRALFRPLPQSLVATGGAFACASYETVIRHAVLQWKDHDDREVGGVFAAHLRGLVRQKVVPALLPLLSRTSAVVAVVPAPSSAASVMARGRLQTVELAAAVAEGLRECGIPARVVRGLKMTGRIKKSVQASGVRSRQHRSTSALVVSARAMPPSCKGVIIVDDICTTGSTLLGCARQLYHAGYRVLAAVTLAAVPA